MSDLIDTTEMYLRTVFELEEEGIVPLRARIAERLGHSGPTVSQTVARMERDGLLKVTGDRHLELSESGRGKATRVMRKHRLAERLLLDVIGLEWELVHDEACRWEHVISEQVEHKLMRLLGEIVESPYGNPIPGLEELGGRPTVAAEFRVGVVGLPVAVDYRTVGVPVTLRRLGEPLQTDLEVLGRMSRAGLRPGAAAIARRARIGFRVEGPDGEIDLSEDAASHVFVALREPA